MDMGITVATMSLGSGDYVSCLRHPDVVAMSTVVF